MNVTVLIESWRPHPLAWVHRAEARAIVGELQQAGHAVSVVRYGARTISEPRSGTLLLRLSDPVMLAAARALESASVPYVGPRVAVMERCYDKYLASCIAAGNGVDCPAVALAGEIAVVPFPLVLKPRQGSRFYLAVVPLRAGIIPLPVFSGPLPRPVCP